MTDPAFLFYPGDYLRDTQCLSEQVQVAYDRIMCEHMRNICISQKQLNFFTKKLSAQEKEELEMVLTKVDGGYQIKWVAESICKRRDYSDSRRKNRSSKSKNISSSHVPHMENENENVIEDEKVIDKDYTLGKFENPLNIPRLLMNDMHEIWKKTFPHYSDDVSSDYPACQQIASFIFRSAGVTNGFGNTDAELKVLNTFQLIADNVQKDSFWVNRPLKSIAGNIQLFYNNIKNPINGSGKSKTVAANGSSRDELNAALNKRHGSVK